VLPIIITQYLLHVCRFLFFLLGVLYYYSENGKPSIGAFKQKDIDKASVNTLYLNVRSGPGTNYGRITKLSQGTIVNCYERTQSSDGGIWVKIHVGSVEGWVNQKLLTSSN
jgi:uncharacterized protein YgiM (DUF1202 family)